MAIRSKLERFGQHSLFEPEKEDTKRPFERPRFLLGTSAFTANGWAGSFYPVGMKSDDYLSFYVSKFRTVEIDSTYYGTPVASTVESWYRKTPPDFIFSAKVRQIVPHTNMLANCEPEFDEFLQRI